MSQSTESDGVFFQLRRDEHIERWEQIKSDVADRKGVAAEELTRPDVFEGLADTYLSLLELRQDKRAKDTIELIAKDHGCDPSDVSFECAFKTAAAAYAGHQTTDDWQLSKNGDSA